MIASNSAKKLFSQAVLAMQSPIAAQADLADREICLCQADERDIAEYFGPPQGLFGWEAETRWPFGGFEGGAMRTGPNKPWQYRPPSGRGVMTVPPTLNLTLRPG